MISSSKQYKYLLGQYQVEVGVRVFISKFRPKNIRACPKKARSYIILSTIQVFFDVKYSCESKKSQKLGLFDYTLHYTLHKNVDISMVPAARLERVRSCLQGILSPWCLPFHHAGRYCRCSI